MPSWDGVYGEYAPDGRRVWNYSRANQVPTLLSLLTPEYQQRMVRQIYHEGVDAAHQWSASYCWPEGFMRQWATGPKPTRVVVTPEVVLFMGSGSGNMWRVVHLNREFPLGPDVRQWYGDTIGFWDGDALITCTANVQGWNQHSSWEWSDSLESIEILTPVRDAGGKFIGLDWEAVLYDSEALAEPVRILWHRNYQQGWDTAERLGWVECTRPLYPVNGFATQVAPGQVIEYQVPDMFDRPWAQIWEEYFEKNMERPNGNTRPRLQMTRSFGGLPMAIKRALAATTRIVTAFGAVMSVGLLAPPAHAHHSYAMYDGSVYRVFTGVVVRVIPNAAHFEMHFVPLNQERNALVRDDKGEPLVWVVQMESAGQAFKDGITQRELPAGNRLQHGTPSAAGWKTRGRPRDVGSVPMSEGRQASTRQALRLGRRRESVRGRRDAERDRRAASLMRQQNADLQRRTRYVATDSLECRHALKGVPYTRFF